MKDYKIGFLMTEGSIGSLKIIEELAKQDIIIDTVFIQKITID